MFNSTSLPTEKIEFDWYGPGPYRSDSRTVYRLTKTLIYSQLDSPTAQTRTNQTRS